MMVKCIAALFLIVGVIKLAGPWTSFVQDYEILFAAALQDEDSKGGKGETKQTVEEGHAVPEPGLILWIAFSGPMQRSLHLCRFIASHHQRPISPPPDII